MPTFLCLPLSFRFLPLSFLFLMPLSQSLEFSLSVVHC